MTHDEFIERYDIKKLTYINFTDDNSSFLNVQIDGNPGEYIDVARQAKNLNFLLIPKMESIEYYKGLQEFVRNCRKGIKVKYDFLGEADRDEFLKAESIIDEVLECINPNWSTKQKIAFIHYKMGKIISYIPDSNYNTISDSHITITGTRNLWNALSSGKSICRGITSIEQNILFRIGIQTKELSSGIHSYLLIVTEEGNIITDATWDLANTLFDAKPYYFGVTYDELVGQEKDIANSHRLKNPPQSVIRISDEELRNIYYSIGIIGEDFKFPLPILKRLQEINLGNYQSLKEKVTAFFKMFIDEFPNELTHLSETRGMLQQWITELGIDSRRIITKFVYSKKDIQCTNPYLVVSIDTEEMRDFVFLLDAEKSKFEEIGIEELDNNYMVNRFDTSRPFWKKYFKKEKIKNQELSPLLYT